jgi:Tripartite tricarboxylate transporter TctB family
MNLSRLLSMDMLSALFVLALGGAGFVALGNAEMGTASEMGTGYLPRLVTLMVLGGGVVLLMLALLRDGESMPPLQAKPLLLISLAIAAFAATIDQLGMVIAVTSATLIASLASTESRWRETLLLSAGIAAGAVAVFILGLKMPVPVWPR